MDVRCERCRAQYVVVDARVTEAGVNVACVQCGHAFLLRKKTLAITVPLKGAEAESPTPIADLAPQAGAPETRAPEPAERSQWRLRQAGGAVFPFRELSTLQRWIVERKASREDEVAAAGEGESWRRLGEIPELQSFFALLEKARRRPEQNPEPPAEPPPEAARSRPGLEDPAWASSPVSPTRRVTRSALRPPPPRRRVVWVALLVLGLLCVAAGTVYLRRKADSDLAAQAAQAAQASQQASAEAAAQAVPAVATPAPAAKPPAPDPKPLPEPPKEQPSPPSPEGTAVPAPQGVAAEPVATPQAIAEPPQAVPVVAAPAPAPPAPAASPAPPKPESAATVLRGLLARAREQRDRGRCEAALDLYGQALALDGRNAAALAGRGACYLDLSRYVQAEASFMGALDSDPRNAEALYGMAETYRYMGRKGDAVTFYEKFLAVRPTGDDAAAARRLISQLKE
jgi:predicted Zn finger-like uncharacterized protein